MHLAHVISTAARRRHPAVLRTYGSTRPRVLLASRFIDKSREVILIGLDD